MIKAQYQDRQIVGDILSSSFDENKSVNYIVKQDDRRLKRIKNLMYYSFDVCYLFGEIFLSEDKNGCALVLCPERKKTTIKTVLMDLNLITSVVGLSNVTKVLNRESKVKQLQPKTPFYHLWYIGVNLDEQNKGIGSKLMAEVMEDSKQKMRPLCLETSTLKNIPWYEKFGFKVYNELDLGYKLFFMKYN